MELEEAIERLEDLYEDKKSLTGYSDLDLEIRRDIEAFKTIVQDVRFYRIHYKRLCARKLQLISELERLQEEKEKVLQYLDNNITANDLANQTDDGLFYAGKMVQAQEVKKFIEELECDE